MTTFPMSQDPQDLETVVGPLHVTHPRRVVLKAAGLSAAGLLASSMMGGAHAYAHGTLTRRSAIADAKTFYEGNGQALSFEYNPAFYYRLESFIGWWYSNTPSAWQRPMRVWTSGVHVDKGSEAHDAGRGFDLSRIYTTGNGALVEAFNARYDLWSPDDKNGRTPRLRRYWATAAAAHFYFQNVLTYLFDDAHNNHIHIDDLVSTGGNSRLSTASGAQISHIQACCTHVWGYPTVIDGTWGAQTDKNSRLVLQRIGGSGGLTSSQANWQNFNQATLRFGTRAQIY